MNLLRRVRAVLNIALFWALLWAGLAMVIVIAFKLGGRHMGPMAEFDFWNYLSNQMILFAMIGGGGSTMFSLTLATLRQRADIDRVSWKTFAGLGALTGALIVLGMSLYFFRGAGRLPQLSSLILPVSIFSVLGASAGLATLAVARRAALVPPAVPHELPESTT